MSGMRIVVDRTQPIKLAGWPDVVIEHQCVGPQEYDIRDLRRVMHPKQQDQIVSVHFDEMERWLRVEGLLHRCVTLHDALAWVSWEHEGYLPHAHGPHQQLESLVVFWGSLLQYPVKQPQRSVMAVEYSRGMANVLFRANREREQQCPALSVFMREHHRFRPWETTLVFPE